MLRFIKLDQDNGDLLARAIYLLERDGSTYSLRTVADIADQFGFWKYHLDARRLCEEISKKQYRWRFKVQKGIAVFPLSWYHTTGATPRYVVSATVTMTPPAGKVVVPGTVRIGDGAGPNTGADGAGNGGPFLVPSATWSYQYSDPGGANPTADAGGWTTSGVTTDWNAAVATAETEGSSQSPVYVNEFLENLIVLTPNYQSLASFVDPWNDPQMPSNPTPEETAIQALLIDNKIASYSLLDPLPPDPGQGAIDERDILLRLRLARLGLCDKKAQLISAINYWQNLKYTDGLNQQLFLCDNAHFYPLIFPMYDFDDGDPRNYDFRFVGSGSRPPPPGRGVGWPASEVPFMGFGVNFNEFYSSAPNEVHEIAGPMPKISAPYVNGTPSASRAISGTISGGEFVSSVTRTFTSTSAAGSVGAGSVTASIIVSSWSLTAKLSYEPDG